jgi:hypothetical protein
MKKLLLTIIATFFISTLTIAQNVPNYVPINGLVGWWPFNGNANDGSGNGNNGAVFNLSYNNDRFNNTNASLDLGLIGSGAEFPLGLPFWTGNYSISFWMKSSNNPNDQRVLGFRPTCLGGGEDWFEFVTENNSQNIYHYYFGSGYTTTTISPNIWTHILFVKNGSSGNLYVDGVNVGQHNNMSTLTQNSILAISSRISCILNWGQNNLRFVGQFDDLGVWNRALTQQEITNLYNPVNCANNTTITPQINSLSTGSIATFTATTTDPNPSYVWQSDFGQGFQTLNNFGNYTGANSSTLNIANVQLSEHNQRIRVISISGNCTDTSSVAVINILDTCITNTNIYDTLLTTITDTITINIYDTLLTTITDTITINVYDTLLTTIVDTVTINIYDTLLTTIVDTVTINVYDTLLTTITDTITINIYDTLLTTIVDTVTINVYDTLLTTITIIDTVTINVYDTLLTTVTDTLIINAQITGTNPPNNLNTLKIYPNPASTHITIDYGNFNTMTGYTLHIINSIGQRVFTSSINQQTSYINLSTWTGPGIYFVQLIDLHNNIIENRKIVIQ